MSFTGLRVRAKGASYKVYSTLNYFHSEGSRLAETELARAEKRYEQAKARLQALRNREAARNRKLDTRRKVILGGALMDLAERDTGAAAMMDRLIRNLVRDQDRKAFTDSDIPSPARASESEQPNGHR